MRFLLALLLGLSATAEARELYKGQYAQVEPQIRKWFNDQLIPGSNQRCCSEADGVTAEPDIRDGHHWVRFTAKMPEGSEVDSGWMEVPDTAVLNGPNLYKAPVVWWGWNNGIYIRCYAPGAGI